MSVEAELIEEYKRALSLVEAMNEAAEHLSWKSRPWKGYGYEAAPDETGTTVLVFDRPHGEYETSDRWTLEQVAAEYVRLEAAKVEAGAA